MTLPEVAVGSTTFTNQRPLPQGPDGVCTRLVDIAYSLAVQCCSTAYVTTANVVCTFFCYRPQTEAVFVKLLWQLLSSYSVSVCMCACTESWVVPNQNLSQAQTWFCYALVESGELLHPLSECLRTVTVHQTTNATYKCTTVRLASISERQKFGRGCGNRTRSLQYANVYLRKSLCNIKDSNTFFTSEGTLLIQGFNSYYTLTVFIVGTTPT